MGSFIKQDIMNIIASRIEHFNNLEKENAELKRQLKLWRDGTTKPIVGNMYYISSWLVKLYNGWDLEDDVHEFEFIGTFPSYVNNRYDLGDGDGVQDVVISANPPYYRFKTPFSHERDSNNFDCDIYKKGDPIFINIRTPDLHAVFAVDDSCW